eukprot:TRINITY_DN1876_c0_g1_i1.p3 TRINITY_DN1876_c0_g1~~TRINITY_DN1876_c0_g1_i1.p3  ORF type:complete len:118 (+),score=1.63 TRINITY_DN1876_c0_g1_i1:47-355(+)
MSLQVLSRTQSVCNFRSVFCNDFFQRAFFADDSLIMRLRKEYPKYQKLETKNFTFIQDTTDQDGKPLYEAGVYGLDKETTKKIYLRLFTNWQKSMLDIVKNS